MGRLHDGMNVLCDRLDFRYDRLERFAGLVDQRNAGFDLLTRLGDQRLDFLCRIRSREASSGAVSLV